MTNRVMTACVTTMCMAIAAGADAQTQISLNEQLDLIVTVKPSGGTPGSGLIIAVEPNRVRILTARHVVEAGAVIPDSGPPDLSAQRDCVRTAVDVFFRWDPLTAIGSQSVKCSDALDAAIIEVTKPATFKTAIPKFSPQEANADLAGYEVYLAGMAEGASWTYLSGAVSSKVPDKLVIRGVGIGPGFSGGGVFDRTFGFAGIIVSAADRTVTAVPAFAVTQWLKASGVSTTHLEGAPSQPDNPHFAGSGSPGAGEENGRNAIRRYRQAFANRDAALLKKAYPNAGSDPLKLFGDASRIDLDLQACTDISPDTEPPVMEITCAFDLNITRKTGPPFIASSCDYVPPTATSIPCPKGEQSCSPGRMVFALKKSDVKNDPYQWAIDKVTMNAATACPLPVQRK